MTVCRLEAHLHEASGAGRGPISLVSRVAGWVRRWQDAARTRRSIKQLLDLDDRLLNDIGLTRGNVVAAISGPFSDDDVAWLSRLTRENQSDNARAGQRARLQLRPQIFGLTPLASMRHQHWQGH